MVFLASLIPRPGISIIEQFVSVVHNGCAQRQAS
jgi:hypothetical protein